MTYRILTWMLERQFVQVVITHMVCYEDKNFHSPTSLFSETIDQFGGLQIDSLLLIHSVREHYAKMHK